MAGTRGLWLWVAACLGWPLGVACQWQAAHLAPARWWMIAAALGLLLAAGAVCGGCLTLWLQRCRPFRRRMAWPHRPASRGVRVLALRCVALLLATALWGWASTGWRLSEVLTQRWPAHLSRSDVVAVVTLTGLPQAMPGRRRNDAAEGDAHPSPVRWRLDADVRSFEGVVAEPGRRLPERLTLYADWPASEAPRAGQTWRMRLRLHPPDGLSNPGVNSGLSSTLGRGVRAVGQVRPGEDAVQPVPDAPALGWQDRIDRWRQSVREDIARRVPSAREAGVLTGLAVGDQAAIAPADWEVLRRTGVAHMVSISGAHVAMLGSLVAALTRRAWARSHRLSLWLPAPTVALWMAVLGAAVYAVLSGGGVPAQRTVWTMALMGGLRLLGRAWPWPLVWLMCVVLITLWDPIALVQPGFWLSFVAVAVLMSAGGASQDMAAIAVGARSDERRGVLSWCREEALGLWHTQRRVSLALMPLSLVCFQQVSLVGMSANLLAVPLFGAVITPLALLGVLVPWAWDVAAALVRWAFQALQWLADTPIAVWGTPTPPMWVALSAVLASFVIAMPGPWRWRSLAVPFLLPLLALPEPWRVLPQPAVGQFATLAMDVGQGTAVLVRTAHHAMLFDTGANLPAGGDMGSRVVLPVLQAVGVRRLDALVISHQDNDHVGGAASVVRGLPVALLRSSLPAVHPLRVAGPKAPALPHQPCMAGQSWTWDGVTMTVLHPTEADLAQRHKVSTNALSCVLRVTSRSGASLLLTGDIEAPQEQALLARVPPEDLRSTVLISPHHGSRTSSTAAFLAAVNPQAVVVQAGRRNRYGHPAPSVMARHADMGVHVDTTPDCGAWLWSSGDAVPQPDRAGLGQCWRSMSRRLWDGGADSDAMDGASASP
jgi:competence protein ComEC